MRLLLALICLKIGRRGLLSSRPVLGWHGTRFVGQSEAESCFQDSGASSSGLPPLRRDCSTGAACAAEMCSDADSEGPVVLAGGDSEEEAPAHCGDVRQQWLATASDDVEMFGAHVQEELGAAELGATVGLGSWEPGWNAGTWVT